MPGGMIGDARKRLAGTRGAGLPGYFIADDYAGDPHVWRGDRDDPRPIPVLARYHCTDAHLWAAIVRAVEGAA